MEDGAFDSVSDLSGNWDALIVDREKLEGAAVENLDVPLIFPVFHFASTRQVLAWEDRGWFPVRAPLSAKRLLRLVRREVDHHNSMHHSSSPRFTPAMLQVLQGIDSSIECECPTNVASMLDSVMAFERYCARCETLAEDDQTLHRRLLRETAAILQGVERMLERVMLHDGIDLAALREGLLRIVSMPESPAD